MAKAQQIVRAALDELYPRGAPREVLARARAALTNRLPDVLDDFSARVAAHPDLRQYQRTTALDVALVSGVADLSGIVDDEDVLLDALRTAEITADGHEIKYPVRLRESIAHLRAKSQLDGLFIFGHLEGTTLTVKNPDTGALDDFTATLKVRANYRVTAASQVHARLVGLAASMLAASARPGLAGGAP
jgi:hypothetical protein